MSKRYGPTSTKNNSIIFELLYFVIKLIFQSFYVIKINIYFNSFDFFSIGVISIDILFNLDLNFMIQFDNFSVEIN